MRSTPVPVALRWEQGGRGAAAALQPLNFPVTMATFAERLPENAPGPYYVDATCIDCDQCRAMAPDFFGRDDDSGLSFVRRQPSTAEEVARFEEISAACATASIGNDGT